MEFLENTNIKKNITIKDAINLFSVVGDDVSMQTIHNCFCCAGIISKNDNIISLSLIQRMNLHWPVNKLSYDFDDFVNLAAREELSDTDNTNLQNKSKNLKEMTILKKKQRYP